ncbi:MAG: plasmid pRiA4b ORF-3 family protein [Acidimicrobiia bacterium]|nr:plasmid pRiA4b ORF-3 family protein [Acidimicrobiia bacterium]
MAKTIHQLKVTLRHVKPPVWRRILVESEVSLAELSAVLVGAMGWMDTHLHLFEVGDRQYGVPDPDWGLDVLDEERFVLDQVLPKVGTKMRWDYDFGDGWEHDVRLEAITLPKGSVKYPVCLAGRRACPPEDCGGPWGYADLLDAMRNPDHPEREELMEWLAPGFDPNHFDREETEQAMHFSLLPGGWVWSEPTGLDDRGNGNDGNPRGG